MNTNPWFEPRVAGVGIVRIFEPYVDEILRSNLWWLRGTDRDIVIDAGLGVVPLRQAVPSMFDRDPLVLLTHAHLDHVGGAHEFTERGAHTADVNVLARGVPASLNGPELVQLLGADDVGSPFPELMITELPYPGYDPQSYRAHPVKVTRRFQGGERIDLGGRTLTVLHLPGHTPGSIACSRKSPVCSTPVTSSTTGTSSTISPNPMSQPIGGVWPFWPTWRCRSFTLDMAAVSIRPGSMSWLRSTSIGRDCADPGPTPRRTRRSPQESESTYKRPRSRIRSDTRAADLRGVAVRPTPQRWTPTMLHRSAAPRMTNDSASYTVVMTAQTDWARAAVSASMNSRSGVSDREIASGRHTKAFSG